jgi:hypothetical protein
LFFFVEQQLQLGPHLQLEEQLNMQITLKTPARPIKLYTTRAPVEAMPPNKSATASYWKKPTRPQFKAPTMIKNLTRKRKHFMKFLHHQNRGIAPT